MTHTWEDIEQLARTQPIVHAGVMAAHARTLTPEQALLEMVYFLTLTTDSLRRQLDIADAMVPRIYYLNAPDKVD